MTPTNLTQLREINVAAKRQLRTGDADRKWLNQNLPTVERLSRTLASEKDFEHQTVILESLRRLADLADLGHYDLSRRLLSSEHLKWVSGQLAVDDDHHADRRAELLWFMLIYSVAQHRSHNVERALSTVIKLERALDPLQARIQPEKYLLLRHRVAFALGRHFQALHQPKEAEHHYTRSLEFCLDYCTRFMDDPEQKTYASYRMSVTMIGLARLFIDRNELERGLRELSVVKLLLTASPDESTAAFVDLLLGQVHRQLGHLDEAIPLLHGALVKFKRKGHHQHYLFCRHELAKAHLNANAFDMAHEILCPARPSDFDSEVEERAEERWKVNDRILEARIVLERQRILAESSPPAAVDEKALRSAKEKIERGLRDLHGVSAGDVRARGLIVKGSIEILLCNYENVEKSLRPIVDGDLGLLDPAEIGWAWLVIVEARLRRHHLEGAIDALAEYGALAESIENIFFSRLSKRLTAEVTRRSEGALVFRPGEPLKPWREYEQELQCWILNQHKKLTLTALHDQLGIAPNTIRGWRENCADRSAGDSKKPGDDQ